MATTTEAYTFTTLGELPADFSGQLQIEAVFGPTGWDNIEVTDMEHGVGHRKHSRVSSPAFGRPGDTSLYFKPAKRVRIAK